MLIVHVVCIGLVGGNGFIYLRIVLRKTGDFFSVLNLHLVIVVLS